MHLRITIVIISGLLCIQTVLAQRQLALLKGNKIITKYGEGEYIRFQRKGDDGFIHAIITGIYPGFFIVGGDSVFTYEVAKIDLSGKSQRNYKVSAIGKGIIQAGVLLMFADVFNTIVIMDRKYEWTSAASVSVIIVATGGLMQFVNNDIFKINYKRRLATLNVQ